MENETINTIQNQIIDDFSVFDQWLDKYEYLIEMGKNLPPFPETEKNEQNLIQGCQSRVWLSTRFHDGMIEFLADSDAIITKGIIGLLIRVLNHRTPQEILDTELYFIDKIGLSQNLSPTRANGLVSMIKQMKRYALVYQQISKK